MVSLMRATIDSNPFISVRQMQSMIATTLNLKVSRELVRIAIKRQGLAKKTALSMAYQVHNRKGQQRSWQQWPNLLLPLFFSV